MKIVRHSFILLILILLSACNDLGALGEEMAASRDAARPTPLIVLETQNDTLVEPTATAPLIVALAKPSLTQAISGYVEVSRASTVLQSAEFSLHLQPNQQYTIFVPTDAAFAANSDVVAEALLTDMGDKSMWRYLIVPQVIYSAELTDAALNTLHGNPLSITTANGVPHVADATLVYRDIEFEQGVIHIIDRTVLP